LQGFLPRGPPPDLPFARFLQPKCVVLDGTGWGLLGLPVTGDESPG